MALIYCAYYLGWLETTSFHLPHISCGLSSEPRNESIIVTCLIRDTNILCFSITRKICVVVTGNVRLFRFNIILCGCTEPCYSYITHINPTACKTFSALKCFQFWPLAYVIQIVQVTSQPMFIELDIQVTSLRTLLMSHLFNLSLSCCWHGVGVGTKATLQ